MTKDIPIACSLGGDELERRLATAAETGADSLISHETKDNRHLLRFQASTAARRKLDGIVTAEAECCSFLDLSLSEEGSQLVLSIAAPANARAFADELAAAFSKATASVSP
jgi:hypothetical protein